METVLCSIIVLVSRNKVLFLRNNAEKLANLSMEVYTTKNNETSKITRFNMVSLDISIL